MAGRKIEGALELGGITRCLHGAVDIAVDLVRNDEVGGRRRIRGCVAYDNKQQCGRKKLESSHVVRPAR